MLNTVVFEKFGLILDKHYIAQWSKEQKKYPFGIRTKTQVLYWYVDMGILISNYMISFF